MSGVWTNRRDAGLLELPLDPAQLLVVHVLARDDDHGPGAARGGGVAEVLEADRDRDVERRTAGGPGEADGDDVEGVQAGPPELGEHPLDVAGVSAGDDDSGPAAHRRVGVGDDDVTGHARHDGAGGGCAGDEQQGPRARGRFGDGGECDTAQHHAGAGPDDAAQRLGQPDAMAPGLVGAGGGQESEPGQRQEQSGGHPGTEGVRRGEADRAGDEVTDQQRPRESADPRRGAGARMDGRARVGRPSAVVDQEPWSDRRRQMRQRGHRPCSLVSNVLTSRVPTRGGRDMPQIGQETGAGQGFPGTTTTRRPVRAARRGSGRVRLPGASS